MKTTDLRTKDVAGLKTEVKALQKSSLWLAYAKSHATTQQHRYAAHCAP